VGTSRVSGPHLRDGMILGDTLAAYVTCEMTCTNNVVGSL